MILFLTTIVAGWGIACELTPPDHPLRWILPLAMALIPAFTDLMTAVNSDAAAVAMLSLFLWGSVSLIQRGISLARLLWILGTAILVYYSKNTAMVGLLVLPVVLLLGIVQGRKRWITWGILLVGTAVGVLLILDWGDPAYWYRSTLQTDPLRFRSTKATAGNYSLRLDSQSKITPTWLVPVFQPLPSKLTQDLAGQTVSLGFWVWADRAIEITTPVLRTPNESYSQSIQIDEKP